MSSRFLIEFVLFLFPLLYFRIIYAANVFSFAVWSSPILQQICSENTTALAIPLDQSNYMFCSILKTNLGLMKIKEYTLPAGVFEIDQQLLLPERTALIGALNPNNDRDPSISPDYDLVTTFLATRGVTEYSINYCHSEDMVNTRVGFVMSSHTHIENVAYQGIDIIRPYDNGALCGGGAFETKGCAENDCNTSQVNNGGSDGLSVVDVTLKNIRLNDFYYAEDQAKIGQNISGNTDCYTPSGCCFCQPNFVRSTQVGVWVPQTRDAHGSSLIHVKNIVSRSTQADGINFHGRAHNSLVDNCYFENTGDDAYVVWGADQMPYNITFQNNIAVNPGVMRPNWYGNCIATYGLQSAVFANMTCLAPTLPYPMPAPEDGSLRIDTSMFVFFTSFGGIYPSDNSIYIRGYWKFADLTTLSYDAANGVLDIPQVGNMTWSEHVSKQLLPYYFPGYPNLTQTVNVYVIP